MLLLSSRVITLTTDGRLGRWHSGCLEEDASRCWGTILRLLITKVLELWMFLQKLSLQLRFTVNTSGSSADRLL